MSVAARSLISPPGADDSHVGLSAAHRRLMAHRAPAFAICWLATTAVWSVVLALEGLLAPGWALASTAIVAALLLATSAVVRVRAESAVVLPVLVGCAVLLGVHATILFAWIRANGDLLAFVLLTLYLAAALFFAWGWRAELVLLAATVVPWFAATPVLRFYVPTVELVAAILVGSVLAIAIAEGARRTFHAAFLHRAREQAARKALEASRDDAERARAEAVAATRAKDQFLATLSHELRSPLNAVLTWTRMLRRRLVDPSETDHALGVIERNALAQLRLIGDLLDVSRIVSGKLRLDLVPLDLRSAIAPLVETLRPAVEAQRLDLRVDLGRRPIPVRADPARVQQIVENLLSNAIKFTPAGGRIELAVRRTDGAAEITVHDTGIGLAPEALGQVFERFHQAASGPTGQLGGLGLGLAIARHLVDLMGGSIDAESAGEGRGATFRVRLPIDRSGASEGRRTREPGRLDTLPTLAGLHVVVVDDAPEDRDSVTRLLSRCGAAVTPAASAKEALEVLVERPANVLVADLAMPEEDGLSLVRKARVVERSNGTPLRAIALTALASAADRERAMRAGYDVHLPKPIDPEEVVAAVAGGRG